MMLNEKQYDLLKFVNDYWSNHDQAPTLQEIKENAKGAYDIQWQINILLSRKYLEKAVSRSRGLSLTEAGHKALEYGPDPDVDTSSIPKRWDNIRRLHDDKDGR